MPKLNRKQIQDQTIALLQAEPGGVRWSDVLKRLTASHPETPANSIRGATHALFSSDGRIEKVARGTYRLASLAEQDDSAAIEQEGVVAHMPIEVETADRL